MTVEQFFTHYAALSMGNDDRATAAVYAPSFFVAGPKGSMTFANDARFLDWLAQVRAPAKQGVWFERSSHMIPWEEPGKLLLSLVQDVRPLAQQSPPQPNENRR